MVAVYCLRICRSETFDLTKFFCVFQIPAGGKSELLETYTQCLCQFVTTVATHSVSILQLHFATVLSLIREKILSNNMPM